MLNKNESITNASKAATGIVICGYMLRDAQQFNDNGVPVEFIKSVHDGLMALSADEQSLYEQKLATIAKNQKAAILKLKMGIVIDIAELSGEILDEGSSVIKRIKSGELSDSDLLAKSKILLDLIVTVKEKLETNGLNTNPVADLEKAYTDYKDAYLAANNLFENRKFATAERNLQTTNLYKRFRLLCKIGKKIWRNVDSVKYNQYVLGSASRNNSEQTEPPGVVNTNLNSVII